MANETVWDKLENAPVTGNAHLSVAEAREIMDTVHRLREAMYFDAEFFDADVHDEMLVKPGLALIFMIDLLKEMNSGKEKG